MDITLGDFFFKIIVAFEFEKREAVFQFISLNINNKFDRQEI